MGTHISHIRSLSSTNWPPVLKEVSLQLVAVVLKCTSRACISSGSNRLLQELKTVDMVGTVILLGDELSLQCTDCV